MPRPTNKEDLIKTSKENFEKLMKTADSMSEAALITPFDFSGDKSRKEGKRNGNEAAEPDTGLADPVADDGHAAVDGNAAVNDTDTQSTEKSNVSRTKSRATMDDISRILTTKVKQKKIQSADARALLEKYGATSVSKLDPKYYDAFLEEASSL
jgi:hypothetical protein